MFNSIMLHVDHRYALKPGMYSILYTSENMWPYVVRTAAAAALKHVQTKYIRVPSLAAFMMGRDSNIASPIL
jgi:hypothetical protein